MKPTNMYNSAIISEVTSQAV